MSADQIAAEALRLPEKQRVSLASSLLHSLPPVAFEDDEGVADALRRDSELDTNASAETSLGELDLHIRQRDKS
jgi:hypothetical protein